MSGSAIDIREVTFAFSFMIPFQICLACALFGIGGNIAGIQGAWAQQLGLPLADAAAKCFWLAPMVVGMAFLLPRRIPAWGRMIACDVLAMCLAVMPWMVLSHGARTVKISGDAPAGLSQGLERELSFPVVVSGSRVLFSKINDESMLRVALRRHQMNDAER